MNKQHELTINISAQSRTNLITNTTFFSMDVETAKKIINFTHNSAPVDLTDATVLLGFEFVGNGTSKIIDSMDGSLVITNPELGQCDLMLPNHFYKYTGQVLIHVYIKFSDGRSLDAGVIMTEFEESWLDQELEEMTTFYVKRFEDLAREIRNRENVLRAELEAEFDGVRAEIENAKNEVRSFVLEKESLVRDTKSEIEMFADEQRIGVESFATDTKTSMNNVANGIKESLERQLDTTKDELATFMQNEKEAINDTATQVKAAMVSSNENLEKEVRTLISMLQNQVRENIIAQETEFANMSEEIRLKLRQQLEDLEGAAELKRVLKELMIEVQEKFEDDVDNILRLASEIRAEMSENEAAVHDFNAHIEDEDIHMTPTERARWEAQFTSLENKVGTRAPENHNHNASDINVGTLNISRIPTGTTATSVALGNHTHPTQTTVTGNAGTATALQTARNIALSGAVTGSVSFDGAADVNMTTTQNNLSTSAPLASVETATAGTSSLVARQDHRHPLQTTVSGNAGSATALQNTRTINGTNFNGTANITTANWGTARDLRIGNLTRSINGSANLTWTLADIGALPTTGGTVTGGIARTAHSGGGNWINGSTNTVSGDTRALVRQQIRHSSSEWNPIISAGLANSAGGYAGTWTMGMMRSGDPGTLRFQWYAPGRTANGVDGAITFNQNGTIGASAIPNLPASRINDGTFAAARIPNLPASRINEGTFAIGRIPTGTTATTVALGNHTHTAAQVGARASNWVPAWGDITGRPTIPTITPSGIGAGTGVFTAGRLVIRYGTVNMTSNSSTTVTFPAFTHVPAAFANLQFAITGHSNDRVTVSAVTATSVTLTKGRISTQTGTVNWMAIGQV